MIKIKKIWYPIFGRRIFMDPDKRRKSQGTQVQCPKCGNVDGPFKPDFASRPVILTCPKCLTKFDGDGSMGPFTVTCGGCDTTQPFTNNICYMCHLPLKFDKEVEMHSFTYVQCSNCRQENKKGSSRCSRCGQSINDQGQVIRIGP